MGLLAAPFVCNAEVVSSISYNPSRMGEYTYLKIADEANFAGGLTGTTMNISSNGTVGFYFDNNSKLYEISSVVGNKNSAINMPYTTFHGKTINLYASYSASNTTVPSGLLPLVKIAGGTQEYKQDSYLQTVNAVNMLKQKVATLNAKELNVTGNAGNNVSLYDGGATKGFRLAGNDIPEPTGTHTNTGKFLKNCRLIWEKRKTSTTPSQEVWVLALSGCTESNS